MRSATKAKVGKDKAYLAFIHAQPCCVGGKVHSGRIEAAHIGPRGLSQKVPDRQALPMCNGHHNALHKLGPNAFWALYLLDAKALIALLNKRFDHGERAE